MSGVGKWEAGSEGQFILGRSSLEVGQEGCGAHASEAWSDLGAGRRDFRVKGIVTTRSKEAAWGDKWQSPTRVWEADCLSFNASTIPQ